MGPPVFKYFLHTTSVFGDITPCSLVERYMFRGNFLALSSRFSMLKILAACSCETQIPFYQAAWRHAPKVSNLHVLRMSHSHLGSSLAVRPRSTPIQDNSAVVGYINSSSLGTDSIDHYMVHGRASPTAAINFTVESSAFLRIPEVAASHLSPCEQIPGSYLEFIHDRFLPNPFQFTTP